MAKSEKRLVAKTKRNGSNVSQDYKIVKIDSDLFKVYYMNNNKILPGWSFIEETHDYDLAIEIIRDDFSMGDEDIRIIES